MQEMHVISFAVIIKKALTYNMQYDISRLSKKGVVAYTHGVCSGFRQDV